MSALEKIPPLYLMAGLAVLGLVIYVKKNGVQGITYNLANASVDAVNGVVTGSVVGLGRVVGIPATNKSQCQIDMEKNNKWDASFSCDAATYIKFLMGK